MSRAQWLADEAADQALTGAQLATKAANKAEKDRKRVEELTPDPHREMVQGFSAQEQSAFLRVGPKRNRWRDLDRFEERLTGLEQRRQELVGEIAAARAELDQEPGRHSSVLADWLAAGRQGERPASRVPELEHRLADLSAEYDATGVEYDRTLRERAEHIERNRSKMVADIRKAVEETVGRYLRLVDELEAARADLLDLRRTEVWAAIFPHESLASEPATLPLVGAKKELQRRHLPGIETGLAAHAVFALLRDDARFCSTVATVDQAAAEQGVTSRKLTGREAGWQQGEPDLVGPDFDAAWGGSAEEREQDDRIKKYAEVMRKRLWGES